MREHGLWRHRAVGQTERERHPRARRRQRLEPERGEDARGANIPGIGDDECAITFVQRPKLCTLVAHGLPAPVSPAAARAAPRFWPWDTHGAVPMLVPMAVSVC